MLRGSRNTAPNRFPFLIIFLSLGATLMGGIPMLVVPFLFILLYLIRMIDFRVMVLILVGVSLGFLLFLRYTPLPGVRELIGKVIRSGKGYLIIDDVRYPDARGWSKYPFPVKVIGEHGAGFGEYAHVLVRKVKDEGLISIVFADRVTSVRIELDFMDSLRTWFYEIFKRVRRDLNVIFREDSPVIEGLLLGRYHESLRDYRAIGVGHLFAVSGMHVYFMAVMITLLIRHIFIRRAFRLLIPPVIIWLYVGVINFPTSAVRAAAMFSVYNFFRWMDRYVHPLNVLGLVGTVNLLLWPYQVHEPSFQLSYMATFGILTAGRNLAGKFGRGFLGNLWDAVAYTFSAQMLVLPVSSMTFGVLHPYGWLATILLAHLLPFLLIGGIMALLANYFGLYPLVNVFRNGCSVFVKISNVIVDAVGRLPFSSVRIGEPFAFYLFSSLSIFSAVLFISSSWHEGQRP